ncbi:hypothetical protein JZ751_020145, partial [Albula glossodonta]
NLSAIALTQSVSESCIREMVWHRDPGGLQSGQIRWRGAIDGDSSRLAAPEIMLPPQGGLMSRAETTLTPVPAAPLSVTNSAPEQRMEYAPVRRTRQLHLRIPAPCKDTRSDESAFALLGNPSRGSHIYP